VGGSGIAVHGFKFSSQNELPPKVIKFCPNNHTTEEPFCKVTKDASL